MTYVCLTTVIVYDLHMHDLFLGPDATGPAIQLQLLCDNISGKRTEFTISTSSKNHPIGIARSKVETFSSWLYNSPACAKVLTSAHHVPRWSRVFRLSMCQFLELHIILMIPMFLLLQRNFFLCTWRVGMMSWLVTRGGRPWVVDVLWAYTGLHWNRFTKGSFLNIHGLWQCRGRTTWYGVCVWWRLIGDDHLL